MSLMHPILQWFFGICIFFIVIGIAGACYGTKHPRKHCGDTYITYSPDTKQYGVMYGAPSAEDDEEEDNQNS